MKKILFIALLLGGCILTGCKRTTYMATNVTFLNMQVGDSFVVETYNVPEDQIGHWCVTSTKELNPSTDTICTLSVTYGKESTVYAVHPGDDTIFIQYHYTLGTFAYGDEVRIPVHVTE